MKALTRSCITAHRGCMLAAAAETATATYADHEKRLRKAERSSPRRDYPFRC